jgi:hypothetical protein
MSVIDSISSQASRLVGDVQGSLKRARLEGERRVLQRQHRSALEALGERTYELVKAGRLTESELDPELSEVEAKLLEIEAKVVEIEEVRSDEGDGEESEGGGESPAEDPSRKAFPMVDDTSSGDEGGAGPGWDAADRFFKNP